MDGRCLNRGGPATGEVDVGWLTRLLFWSDEDREDEVHKVEDFAARAEVCSQIQLSAEMFERGLVELNVRPAEAVDRLLRVANEEEFALAYRNLVPAQAVDVGCAGGEEGGDLQLQWVGVLELIDQEVGKAPSHRFADFRVVAQEPGGEHQQVVELENATLAAVSRAVKGELLEAAEDGHEAGGLSGGDDEGAFRFGRAKRPVNGFLVPSLSPGGLVAGVTRGRQRFPAGQQRQRFIVVVNPIECLAEDSQRLDEPHQLIQPPTTEHRFG